MKLKKVLASILCVAMVLSTMSFSVFAEATVYEVANDEELAEALSNAVDDDVIKLAPGEYTGGISVGANITLEGSVDADGNPITVFSGDNDANDSYYYYSIYMNKGTIKNIKIVNAWKGIMTEGVGSLTIDNVTMEKIAYGIHIAEAKNADDIVTIENCHLDITWANSFCGGAYKIIMQNNVFTAEEPYYGKGSGANAVNTFNPNTIVSENIFEEDAKILIREEAKDGVEIGANYYEEGFENALSSSCAEGVVIETYYPDREMTEEKITPKGTLNSCRVNVDSADRTFITTELGNVYAENSIKLEILDADGKVIATTVSTDKVFEDITFPIGSFSIFTGINSTDDFWTTTWATQMLRGDIEPAKAVFYADNIKTSEIDFTMKGASSNKDIVWSEVPGVFNPRINGVYLGGSYDNAYLCVEVYDFYLGEKFEVRYFSNDDHIATASLKEGMLSSGAKDSIGCCLGFNGDFDEYWKTEWIVPANAEQIPDKVEVYVDDVKIAEKEGPFGNFIKGWDPASNGNWLYELINEDWIKINGVHTVAKVGEKGYATIEAAVAALEEGDTLAIASGRYDGFDILVDDVTITGMTPDAEITINSIPGNAFIGINAEGVSVENLKFIIPEDCQRTGDYLDGFDAVIGYWSNNFNAGSNVTTGYDVRNCYFVNEHPGIGVAMFNFSSFEIVGNTFENFNVGIHTMSDGSAMGDVVINGNTFINVNEPVNVYWGQKGNDDDSIAITGNNFVSAKDADEIKITIHDYASTVAGTSGIDAIDLSGNTYSAATEVELVDAATDVSSSVESALENVENVIVDTKYSAVARIGEDKYFTSVEAAVAGAQANDIITIFAGTYNGFNVPAELNNVTFVGETDVDGNNLVTIKTLEDGIESHNGGVFVQAETTTFKNLNFTAGTVLGARSGWMSSSLGNTNGDTGMSSSLKNLTVENCNFVGSGVQYAIWTNQGNVTVKNSTITNYDTAVDNYAIGADQKMVIENTEITDVRNAFHTGEAVDGSQIVVTETTINSDVIDIGGAAAVTITSSEISNAVITTYTEKNQMTIADTLFINSVINEEAKGTYNDVNIAEDYDAAVAAVAANNEIISTKLNISFRQVEAGLYDIVLNGEDDIYEFVGAELTFDNDSLTAGNEYMNYEILGIGGKTNAEKSIEKADTYALRLVDSAERMCGSDLVIGQVKFYGQGDINFTVSEGTVVTTEYGTNLGQYYTLDANTLTVDAITNGAVEEVTRTVVVNVAYKHALDGTYWSDNQITVTLKDGFGNIYGPFDVSDEIETIPDVKLGRLTVTLEAPGFRKYVYNTTLEAGADENDHLVLNFWNDIKRNTVQSPLAEIEAGVSGETDKNFVVGDIVMDYTVDEYDLAAVTSYYGMYELTDADKYIKYDLNRDGNIDIIDVHYVLHTLNN